MKKKFYEEELPDYDEELWDGSLPPPRSGTPRRAQRKKKKSGSAKLVIGILFGLLLGLSAGMLSRFLVITNSGIYMMPGLFGGGFFDQGDGSYQYDGDFDFGHSGDVETNEEASNSYSLPQYQGDSSGLTIDLQSGGSGTALSRTELYEKDLPTTVSITVYAGTSAAYGSGMILTEDGYVLTCAHVIDNTESAAVTTSDGTEYQATLVGSDPQTDLAVLKIEAHGLTPAQFASSDDLVIGEEVCAIGDPLGPQFRSSLTNGIISGLNRQVSSNGYAMTLIQTTAPVNSGNSGGPLFNSRGQVIGVVNMKMSSTADTASIDNMGLAVPSTIVKEIVETLAAEGSVSRAVLGISCYPIDKATANIYGMPEGLWITNIDENSDCQKQGILIDDIITEVDGIPVSSVSDFKALTADFEIGDTVTLTIWRDSEQDQEDGSSSASTEEESESHHYEYYGEITVALVSSTDVAG